jgi:magnesium chelatase subunit D
VSSTDRAEILRRNLQFSRNPLELESRFHADQEALRAKIVTARGRYPSVEIADDLLDAVALIVERAGADGHRADIAMLHSARALAALEERDSMDISDLARVANLALNHRVRKGPLGTDDGKQLDVPALMAGLTEIEPDALPGLAEPAAGRQAGGDPVAAGGAREPAAQEAAREGFEEITLGEPLKAATPGKRGSPQATGDTRGRYYRSASPTGPRQLTKSDIAIDATIRASAARGASEEGGTEVLPEDIKVKLRKRKVGATILFVVDASASMGAKKRLDASREAILSLLVEAYQKRDRVGLVVFKDNAAQLVMSPTSSPALAGRLLAELAPGGTTPLSHGLALARQVLDRELSRNPAPAPVLVLISDGGGNVTMGSSDPMREALDVAAQIRDRGIKSIVLDSAPRHDGAPLASRPTAARRIAEAMGGTYFPARNISGESILDKVSRSRSETSDEEKVR